MGLLRLQQREEVCLFLLLSLAAVLGPEPALPILGFCSIPSNRPRRFSFVHLPTLSKLVRASFLPKPELKIPIRMSSVDRKKIKDRLDYFKSKARKR